MKRLLSTLALILLLAVGGWFYSVQIGQGAQPVFRSQKVEEGEVIAAISASGTLAAVVTVQVSSQLSGQIKELLADFNTEVKQGQPLAILDPQIFEARVQQARAELEVARAGLNRARAELGNARAALAVAEANAQRAQVQSADAGREKDRKTALSGRGIVTQRDIDRAVSESDAAGASSRAARAQEAAQRSAIASAEAGIATAEAAIRQREAALSQAQIDLDRTTIRAPVDGVVIQRNIDRGQTVAASLSAPVLFQLAQDLREMEVYANIDEADIGRVQAGQRASFTVDAFGGRTFEGRVKMVRKGPQVVQNVVTYVAVISTANADLRLLPGMTATVRIVTAERPYALKVANAALRYRPPGANEGDAATAPEMPNALPPPDVMAQRLTEQLKLAPDQSDKVLKALKEGRARTAGLRAENQPLGASTQRSRQEIAAILTPEQRTAYAALLERARNAQESRPGRVWIIGADGKPVAIPVRTGIGDGTMTEVIGGDLKPGQEVLIGHSLKTASTASAPRWGL